MTSNHTTEPSEEDREYRKTATIKARQWWDLGDHPAVEPYNDQLGTIKGIGPYGWCPTLEGGHIVSPGDWIATGVKGEHWPIKPDVFAASYEPVEARALSPSPDDRMGEDIADAICTDVAELPDRTSPDDWPEAMLVTAEELRDIVLTNLATTRLAASREGGIDAEAVLKQTGLTGHQAVHFLAAIGRNDLAEQFVGASPAPMPEIATSVSQLPTDPALSINAELAERLDRISRRLEQGVALTLDDEGAIYLTVSRHRIESLARAALAGKDVA